MFEVWKMKFFWSVWVLKMLGAPTWQWQPFSEKSELWCCLEFPRGNGRNFEKVWALILLEVCSEKSELWCCLEFPRGNGRHFEKVWAPMLSGVPTWKWPPFWKVPTCQWLPFLEKSELWCCLEFPRGNDRHFEKVWAPILLGVPIPRGNGRHFEKVWAPILPGVPIPRGNSRYFEKVWALMLSGVPTWQWPPFWEVLARPAPAGSLFIVPRKLGPWGGGLYTVQLTVRLFICTQFIGVVHTFVFI